tara:strand:- start:20419 stop:20658 length:240 start_codon:yes stop_codon:yes gene_type:complete
MLKEGDMTSKTIIQGGSYGARLRETFNPEDNAQALVEAAERTGYAGGLFNDPEKTSQTAPRVNKDEAMPADNVLVRQFG